MADRNFNNKHLRASAPPRETTSPHGSGHLRASAPPRETTSPCGSGHLRASAPPRETHSPRGSNPLRASAPPRETHSPRGTERIQSILSHAGVTSRRHAAELIEAGRVSVDGKVVTEPYLKFDPATAKICVDGRPIDAAREQTRTIMLYKPVGVLSTLSDPFGGETVADLLRGKIQERLVPVGRLDKDSEGLLLMSNDGELTLKLTHPRFEHEKTYIVRAAGRWNDEKLRILQGPVTMPDGYVTRPVPVEVVRPAGSDNVTVLCFRLREGRKRQIRYMCSAAHLVVLSLKRVAVGELRLPKEMKPGEWRDLGPDQLKMLGI